MQFFCITALAAALSLRGESDLRQPGDGPPKCVSACEDPCSETCDTSSCKVRVLEKIKEHCAGTGGAEGPPECIKTCENPCDVEECDMSACSEEVLGMIKDHCESAGGGGGPPECVKDCENPCTPECDKSKCPPEVVPIIETHCKHAGTDQTVINEPLPDKMQVEANIAKRIHDNVAKMEKCDETVDCSPTVVENCKMLWDAKLKTCVEKAEEWAYHCPAPTYNGHNCAIGCCSEVSQDVQEDCGDSMPPPEEVWEYVSGDDDKITREEFEGGLMVLLPAPLGEYVPKLADCLMLGYDLSSDGVIDEDEFMKGFGNHLPKCMEEHVPKELLAKMANHKNCGDEGDTLETLFKQLSGGDDEIMPADLAAMLGMQVPQFAEHAMPMAECVVKLVDRNEDGAVQFDEFQKAAEQDLDIMTPCIEKHIPRDELANAAAHNDEHWCKYTDPKVEPCCQESSHEEQDKCMAEKMDEGHYCDFTSPKDEPCCEKQSHEDQDACLEAKKKVFSQKKRKPHLLNKGVQIAFSRFLHSKTVKSLSTKVVKL